MRLAKLERKVCLNPSVMLLLKCANYMTQAPVEDQPDKFEIATRTHFEDVCHYPNKREGKTFYDQRKVKSENIPEFHTLCTNVLKDMNIENAEEVAKDPYYQEVLLPIRQHGANSAAFARNRNLPEPETLADCVLLTTMGTLHRSVYNRGVGHMLPSEDIAVAKRLNPNRDDLQESIDQCKINLAHKFAPPPSVVAYHNRGIRIPRPHEYTR